MIANISCHSLSTNIRTPSKDGIWNPFYIHLLRINKFTSNTKSNGTTFFDYWEEDKETKFNL